MDFFERQEKARRTTRLLLCYFILSVVITITAIYLSAAFILLQSQPSLWDTNLFVWVNLGTLSVIGAGSLYKTAALNRGGHVIALSLGGQALPISPQNLNDKKLRNVVEEMSIASGIRIPKIYVMRSEHGINAFAAGLTTQNATIAVTQGCIDRLTRDELQGVIAHEFSHILNGDMRLNLRLIGMVHGILCLTIIGRILMRMKSSRNKKGGNPLPLLGLILWIVGWIGVFFARLIKSAVSRQREFLADAAAVQFTRNPGGLRGALEKIRITTFSSFLESPSTEEVSHLFFANGLRSSWFSLFATHPPLEERIKALGDQLGIDSVKSSQASSSQSLENDSPISHLSSSPPLQKTEQAKPQDVVASIGQLTSSHIQYAAELNSQLPELLLGSTRDPMGAVALVYSLILSPEEATRHDQLQKFSSIVPPMILEEMKRLHPNVKRLEESMKIPLVDIALVALRRLSPSQCEQFKQGMVFLIQSDKEINLFEFALQKLIVRHLDSSFGKTKPVKVEFYSLEPLTDACAILCSALAYCGSEDHQVEKAFADGTRTLPGKIQLKTRECYNLEHIDNALNQIAKASFPIKKNILNACASVVSSDGYVHINEGELIRAIADSLDCPIPPFISQKSRS
jgi:Zn-dependent protease with chaperone function